MFFGTGGPGRWWWGADWHNASHTPGFLLFFEKMLAKYKKILDNNVFGIILLLLKYINLAFLALVYGNEVLPGERGCSQYIGWQVGATIIEETGAVKFEVESGM